jgi:hypothetical protein
MKLDGSKEFIPWHVDEPAPFDVEIEGTCEEPKYSWSFADGSESSERSPIHTYGVDHVGERDVSVRVCCKNACTTEVTRRLLLFNAEIINPSGDPEHDGSSNNHFVLKGAQGIAEIRVDSRIEPQDRKEEIEKFLRWRLESEELEHTWEWDGGTGEEGQTMSPILKVRSYPKDNYGFGRKTIVLTVRRSSREPAAIDRQDFFLFFEKTAVVAGRPNWFRYWSGLLFPSTHLDYRSFLPPTDPERIVCGQVPAMVGWSYGGLASQIPEISDDAASEMFLLEYCNFVKPRSGILLFANVVHHELRHVAQIAEANECLWTSVEAVSIGSAECDPWTFGWSWNQRDNHNHFVPFDVVGLSKPGVPGKDDDRNGKVDDLVCSRGELGRNELGQSVPLNDLPLYDLGDDDFEWPNCWGQKPPDCEIHALELEAREYADINSPEDADLVAEDWSAPGCQFKGEGRQETDCLRLVAP